MESNRKSFWSLLSTKLKGFGKWLLGGIVALVVLIIALVGIQNSDNKDSDKTETAKKPEIAQVYEPSIGTPLPPDTTPSDNSSTTTPADTGIVAGAATTEPSKNTTYTAPQTGINDTDPIQYENSEINFKAVLPAHAIVKENKSSVSFYSATGKLLYQVDAIKAKSDLRQIYAQIKTSPEVTKVIQANFAGHEAIQFTTKKSVGYALVIKDQVYYFTGNTNYLKDITI